MRRLWSDDDMRKAIDAVSKQDLAISTAAKMYSVPRMTLSDRLKGRVDVNAKLGRPPILGEENEAALVKYISYMASQRFPVTRSQVIGLAWAIALHQGRECFEAAGPTRRWWRGFRDRYPIFSLRKPEFVDRGRLANATSDTIDDYFDILEHTLKDNAIMSKPHRIYNCDEAAIFLNKSSERVLVPAKSKRCHTLVQGTSQHVSVLCCLNAAGETIPPLIIYSKGLPRGNQFQAEGPPNATYSSSESGFIDRDIYAEWFEKKFLQHASKERPLLLLQDGATAHLSPQLIDLAIENNIVLLCFPPKLTHILQPCDVVVFKRMKSEISRVMHQVRMLRGDVWINKQRFPAVFKYVCEKTFTTDIIKESFRKCGIQPFNRDAISKELLQEKENPIKVNEEQSSEETDDNQNNVTESSANEVSDTLMTDDEQCVLQLAVESVMCEEIPEGAEVMVAANHDPTSASQPCPPDLALRAIEQSLTPRKRKLYNEQYIKGCSKDRDPVYLTWSFLKQSAAGRPIDVSPLVQPESSSDQEDENPLVKAGVIPSGLAKVLTSPIRPQKHAMYVGKKKTCKARVLTSDEIASEIREHEIAKQTEQKEKQQRKEQRTKKRLLIEEQKQVKEKERHHKKQQMEQNREVIEKLKSSKKRAKAFQGWQKTLMKCKTFNSFAQKSTTIYEDVTSFPLELCLPTSAVGQVDDISFELLKDIDGHKNLTPIKTPAYGDCFPCTASYYMFGNTDHDVEVRVRIAIELAMNATTYLDDQFLSGNDQDTSKRWSLTYAMFSDSYEPGTKLTKTDVHNLYKEETMAMIKTGVYMGIWQIHAMASILGVKVQSVYPGKGSVSKDLNRIVVPRTLRAENLISIMWTSTSNSLRTTWWEPNHFVPLLPDISDPQTLIPVIKSTDVKEHTEVGDDITEVEEEEVGPDIIEQIEVHSNVIDVQEASPVIKSTDGKEQMKPNHFVPLLPDISDPQTLIPVIKSTDVKEQMEVGDDITEVEEEVSPDIIEQIKVHSNVIDVQEANPVIKSTDGKEQMDYITEVEEQTTTDDMEVCISLFFMKLTHLYSQLGPHQKFTCTPTNYLNVHVKM